MEYINLVNKQSSPSLQRRVFSAALVEVSMFCNAVCDDLMKHWASAPTEVAMDYVCAVMNDTAAILDRLEQIESSFSSACVAEQARRRGAYLSTAWIRYGLTRRGAVWCGAHTHRCESRQPSLVRKQ